MEIARNIK